MYFSAPDLESVIFPNGSHFFLRKMVYSDHSLNLEVPTAMDWLLFPDLYN